jgi:hypothetical protein
MPKYTKVVPYWEVEEIDDGQGGTIKKYKSTTNLPSPDDVRRQWCFGLPLATEDGTPMTDEDIISFMNGAIARMERELGVFLKPTIIACNGEMRGLEPGVDFDIEEPPYDYDYKQWFNYGFLQLRHRPVIELHEFKLVLPNNQIIFDFMTKPEWLKTNPRSGQVRIVPYAGDPTIFSLAGSSLSGYPFLTGLIQTNVPQMIFASYVAGFELGQIPSDIVTAVGKMAAIDILGVAGDAVMVGIAGMSTSIDGLSESVSLTASATSATYGAHIKQLQDEVKDFFSAKSGNIRSAVRGVTFTVL